MLSLHDVDRYAIEALHDGALGYVLKDADPRHLRRALEEVAAGHQVAPARLRAPDGPVDPWARLTARERGVLQLVAEGFSHVDVGLRLGISARTVEVHAGDEESSIAQSQAIFDTNFFGTVRMCRAVVPHMRRRGAGRILNMGSGLGLLPMPFMAVYTASKHAIYGYSEALDHELRNRGIRVSVIEPGITKTPFDANLLEPDATIEEYRSVRAALNQRYGELLAAGDSLRRLRRSCSAPRRRLGRSWATRWAACRWRSRSPSSTSPSAQPADAPEPVLFVPGHVAHPRLDAYQDRTRAWIDDSPRRQHEHALAAISEAYADRLLTAA